MDKRKGLTEYFAKVETTKAYDGYFCSVEEALTIVILGSLCGLRNVNQIHQWASSGRVNEFLSRHFGNRKGPMLLLVIMLVKTNSAIIVKPVLY
jgi:hypothetical protein